MAFQFKANLGEGGFQGFVREGGGASGAATDKHRNVAAAGVLLLIGIAMLYPSPMLDVAGWGPAQVQSWAHTVGCAPPVAGAAAVAKSGGALARMNTSMFLAACHPPDGRPDGGAASRATAGLDRLKEAFADQLLGPEGDFWAFLDASPGALLLLLCVALPTFPRLACLYLYSFGFDAWVAPLLSASGSSGFAEMEPLGVMFFLAVGVAPHAVVAWLLNGALRAANPVVVACAQFLLLQQTAVELGHGFPSGWVAHVMASRAVLAAGAQSLLYNLVITYVVPNFALRWYVQYTLLLGPGIGLARSIVRLWQQVGTTAASDAPSHRAGEGEDKVD
jgi:hypothetical protein